MTARLGTWIIDPDTGEDTWIYYDELDEDIKTKLFAQPIGGFIFSAEEFKASNITKPKFYIDRWLPERGKIMIYAPAKSGKSFLCMQLAHCLGQGIEFLNMPTQGGKVLYIQFELGEEILRNRLQSTNITYENVFVGTSFTLKLDTKDGQNKLELAVSSVRPNVLILDPLYKAITGDENEATDMRIICDFLDYIIETYLCSVILIHHTGKDKSKGGRGSSVFEDWVDSYISMSSKTEKGSPMKATIKEIFLRHAAALEPYEVTFNKQFEFELDGFKQTIKEKVAEIIRCSTEPTKPKEIFTLKIGSSTSVNNALKELVEEGKIEKIGWGDYQWKRKEK
jgi:hypothetical protein